MQSTEYTELTHTHTHVEQCSLGSSLDRAAPYSLLVARRKEASEVQVFLQLIHSSRVSRSCFCSGPTLVQSSVDMTHASRYGHVKKKDHKGKYKAFTAARAVGLAVEKAHRAAKDKGQGEVQASDVEAVHVIGDLQILQNGSFVDLARGGCSLALQPAEQQIAVALMKKQREFLSDCGINFEPCVFSPVLRKGLDLVGDFSSSRNWGITGKVWIELKAFTCATFDSSFGLEEKKVKAQFLTLQGSDPRYHSAMLLACRLKKEGSTWGMPSLKAKLLVDGEWQDISRGACRKHRAGKVSPGSKPNLAKVFSKMAWDTVDGGGRTKYGIASEFMTQMGLIAGSPGKKCGTWNNMLENAGKPYRFTKEKFLDKPGQEPWVGNKHAFRFIWDRL